MASTLGGQMNAMDMQVAGVYDSGSDATNDKYMRFTFDFAQSLYDTQMAEKIVVLLDDWQRRRGCAPPLGKARRRRHRDRDKDVERAFPVLFEGEGHVRHDVPLHLLHRPRDRRDEHGEHHGYGGAGEDKGDRDACGPSASSGGASRCFSPWKGVCWVFSGASSAWCST